MSNFFSLKYNFQQFFEEIWFCKVWKEENRIEFIKKEKREIGKFA
jgi:hypothetical protein